MVNGKSSRGSPKKTAASSNRQPPVVVKEDVPEEPAGHNGEAQHEGEEDGTVPSDVNVVTTGFDLFVGDNVMPILNSQPGEFFSVLTLTIFCP